MITLEKHELKIQINKMSYKFNQSTWYWYPEVKSIDERSIEVNCNKCDDSGSILSNRPQKYNNDNE